MHALLRALCVPLGLCALPPTGVARGQAPSTWAELVFPGGVNANQATSLGKIDVYRESSTLFAYSSVTRRWHATTASPTATIFLTNDCLLIMDGGTYKAFAATRGVFAPLAVSPQAVLLNPSSQNNDEILLVRDGAALHTFTGFVGAWSTRLVGPAAGVVTKRNVALLADGNVVSGMDAYTGQWHDLTLTSAPTSLDADGAAGIVIEPPFVHGFSANRAAWQSAPLPAGATMARDDDWVVFFSPTEMLGYSGQQGRFEHAPLGATAVHGSEDHFGVLDTSFGLVPFSAVRGSFGPPLGPSTAHLTTGTSVALVIDNGVSLGYSALRNTVAPIAANTALESASGVIAVTQDIVTSQWLAYSAITGQWHAAPPDVLPAQPLVTSTGALFTTTGGLRAFSTRSGSFVPLPGTGLQPLGSPSSAIAAAYDATHLFAFDARTDRWRSAQRAGSVTPPVVQIWRTTLQATDGGLAYGFGAQSGEWTTTPLPEAFATGRANSESGQLITQTRLLGYSPLPEVSGWPQFPAFRRVMTAGTTARLSLPLAAGDFALLAIGWQGPPVAVTGLGELLLNPTTMVTRLLLPAPGEAVLRFDLAVPHLQPLVGAELCLQPLLVRTGLQPYLGELTVLSLW